MLSTDPNPMGIKEAITDVSKRALRYIVELLRLATAEGRIDLARISRYLLALVGALILAALAFIALAIALVVGIASMLEGNYLAATLIAGLALLLLAALAFRMGVKGLAHHEFLKQTRSQINRDLP